MTAPVFPVRLDELKAKLDLFEVRGGQPIEIDDVVVHAAKLNHPGGVHAYRVTHRGRSVVFATDTEHYACIDPELLALAKEADVLIYDAQYTEEEYAKKVGWGHSTYVRGCEVARAAGVGRLVLFHHDPSRNDAMVDEIEERAKALFEPTVAAREGMSIDLPGCSRAPSPAPDGADPSSLVAA
jgi:ribonuclease BN (tRNA processing enzyme)